METRKDGTDEPLCRAGIETQTQGTNVWTPRREGEGQANREAQDRCPYSTMRKRESEREPSIKQE